MSKKLFREVVQEVKESATTTAFSKTDFNKLMLAYINDEEFIANPDCAIKTRDGIKVLVKKHKSPVKEFRKMLVTMLVDMGTGKEEAKNFMKNYEFKDASAMYDFMNNFIYHYIETGRSYRLFEKEDIVASIFIKEKKGGQSKTTLFKDGKPDKVTITEKEDYNALGQKSSCPKWKKGKVDESGTVAKAFADFIDEF